MFRPTPEGRVVDSSRVRPAVHNREMKSRVHPTYKTRCRVRNWASYEHTLIQRGDVTVWLSADAIAAWEPEAGDRRGGQRQYSDIAIETALTLRLIFHLPLRQAEGFLTSLFALMSLDLPAPDHTTLSRRGQLLDVSLRHLPRDKRLHLLIDSTGLSMFGEGEWAAAKHGGHGKRGWKKLHLGVNRSGVIVGVVARIVTGPHDANRQGPHLPMLYDAGRPRAVIRFKMSQPRTASLPCPAGLRARRPSPMIDLYRKNAFSTQA